ncbi:hypothetical protein PUNSTDRAFT_98625, partial [Punctularia strigosozonata HHB-11173 SS5]|uniref:uncharacterized protein n=1 Tax=Punctularia strigosozonata (strain HHB-11173) TaxID=741275 RepID=UPI0004416F3C
MSFSHWKIPNNGFGVMDDPVPLRPPYPLYLRGHRRPLRSASGDSWLSDAPTLEMYDYAPHSPPPSGHKADPTCAEAHPGIAPRDPVGWALCARVMKDHDHEMVKSLKDEIDSLLVFAGLFSAVVTTFVVDSYKNLQQDYGETSTQLLYTIAQRLDSQNNSSSETQAPHLADPNQNSYYPSSSSIRINSFWFS